MLKTQNAKKFDLEERTLKFAIMVKRFIKKCPKKINNIKDIKQLLKSSGSVGANYIEANEALSRKDFILRIKICRKEAKESKYWLTLMDLYKNRGIEIEKEELKREANELTKIFGSIITKFK